MEATKDHISLETAKLLKDCGVESRYWYLCIDDDDIHEHPHNVEITELTREDMAVDWSRTACKDSCPAYTWKEIEDNADKFFNIDNRESYWTGNDCYELSKMKLFLELNKYEEADLYFRENTILIKS